MNVKDIVEKYIKLRDLKTAADAEHKKKMKKVTDAMNDFEAQILKHFIDTGQESARTEAGTVFKAERTSSSVADWDLFFQFAQANDLMHMIEHRVSKAEIDKYREANEGQLPPGINWSSETVVQFRR